MADLPFHVSADEAARSHGERTNQVKTATEQSWSSRGTPATEPADLAPAATTKQTRRHLSELETGAYLSARYSRITLRLRRRVRLLPLWETKDLAESIGVWHPPSPLTTALVIDEHGLGGVRRFARSVRAAAT